MSRTEELRQGGGRERGGAGGGAPFVKWGDEYTWVEGKMTGSFQTKYGLAVTLDVTGVHSGGLQAQGRDEEGNNFTDEVRAGEPVNIGTQSAALQGKITEDDVGKHFHVAFEGWEHPQGGNRYRVFSVIEITPDDTPVRKDDVQRAAAGPGMDDDDGLPF